MPIATINTKTGRPICRPVFVYTLRLAAVLGAARWRVFSKNSSRSRLSLENGRVLRENRSTFIVPRQAPPPRRINAADRALYS